MINPVAVASVLVYVIAASVALYFIWLFVFAGLNRKSGRACWYALFCWSRRPFLVRV